MSEQDVRALSAAIKAGDRGALARAITLIESTRADHRKDARILLEQITAEANSPEPGLGDTIRLGISGVPGVGKSSFIECFGSHIIEQGHRLAVLTVDPSSVLSGGSILGDKTRMEELSRNENAFIRSSPSSGTLGGVTRRTRESIVLCEAAGFDVVIVETVGVGQSEISVAGMTDMFLLLLLPGGGDELQGIKRGIVELADLVLVNKADGDRVGAAQRAIAEYSNALRLLRPRSEHWTVPVASCSALTGAGVADAWESVQNYRKLLSDSGEIATRRSQQAKTWLWSELSEELLARFKNDPDVRNRITQLENAVIAGETNPTSAVEDLLGLNK
jgi:LAO/AO transport system kinase